MSLLLRIGFIVLFLLGSGYAYLKLSAIEEKPSKIIYQKAPSLSSFAQEQQSLDYLNTLRVKAGMSAFLHNNHLKEAAKSHASYLVTQGVIGHYEERGKEGFTGVTPQQRVIHAGYKSGMSIENVSNNTIGYKASIEGLFSAIYHRFGFLDFQVDEIGVGMAQNPQALDKIAYVYDMGIYELNDLCQRGSYQGRGAYVYHICADSAFRIEKKHFKEAYNACYLRNQKIVIYPFANQKDVPPAFFDEEPDPLPAYRVSGFPISIQFNPYYFKHVKVKRFELFHGQQKVETIAMYDYLSDINSLFKRNEFALFPKERLCWGSDYRVEVVYLVDGKEQTKVWHFQTKKLPSKPIMIEQKQSQITISNTKETILYLKPQHPNDILEDIEYDPKLDIEFIDKNTIMIKTKAASGEYFRLHLSGRVVEVVVE